MARARFLISTGRTSTQFLATKLSKELPGSVVHHEAIGAKYLSRRIFRRPVVARKTAATNQLISETLTGIEDCLAAGQEYIDVGWPSFAWIPYLSRRFGDDLRFMHLVRNPFMVAASLTTHGLFSTPKGRANIFEKLSMIHASDKRVFYTKIAAKGAAFTAFERNLFHWLELNQFALEQHETKGFAGFARFEDLYDSDSPQLDLFLSRFCELDTLSAIETKPHDRYQLSLSEKIQQIDEDLLTAVYELAGRLGYTTGALDAASNVDSLQAIYDQKRIT